MKLPGLIFSLAMSALTLSAFCQGGAVSSGAGADLSEPRQTTGVDDGGVSAVPKKDRLKNKELPQISVIDKFLSIESALSAGLNRSTEGEWVRDYNELYQKFREDGVLSGIRGGGKNPAYTALALGIKASDGVLALKARNIEALKNSADQIEILARRLGATEGELGMADTIKIYADKNQWFNAFLALGRLQRDMLGYLRSNPEKTDLAVLVIVGGWLQGGRCVTYVVDKHYNDYVSNVLREQRLVDMLRENMEKLAPVYLNDPLIADLIGELPEIRERVNVGLRDPVKHEDVKWLHLKFEELVSRIMTPDPPPLPPEEAVAPDANLKGPLAIPHSTSEIGHKDKLPTPLPRSLGTGADPDLESSPQKLQKGGNLSVRPTLAQEPRARGYWPFAGGSLVIVVIAVLLIRWKVGRRAA